MKTPLYIRPLDIRLRIAYMATKDMELKECDDMGNTFSRMNSYDCGEFRHPYAQTWVHVAHYYDVNGLGNLSDQTINARFAEQLASDKSLRKCVDRWEKLGWKEYEYRRDGRRRAVRKFAMPAIVIGGAFFGINLPVEDA